MYISENDDHSELILKFVILYLLSLVPWPNNHVIKLLCSKDNTRAVRKLLQTRWTPIFEKYQVKLPLECPFHPYRDVFAPLHEAKKRNRPTQWTCRLCGKSFFEEKFVDNHFEHRHKGVINEAEDAVCLADYCDIMRCELFLTQGVNFMNGDSFVATEMEVWGDSSIQSLSLSQTNLGYPTSPVHRKRDTFYTSSLTNSRTKSEKTKFYTRQLLQITDQKSSKSQQSINEEQSKPNSKNLSDEQASQSNSEDKKKQTDYMTNIQKLKANCKQEELDNLKRKCEILIRTCIAGLLLHMSDYAFKEMEEDLNKAVCWYLTCDRYWEDGPLEAKAFPWGLILVLVMVLSLGICFCYYIIWILFDSEESISNTEMVSYHTSRHSQKSILDRRKDNSKSSITIMDTDQDIKHHKHPDESVLQSDGNEFTSSEHYIYVTYPPDLKRRLLENYD